jgi:type I restriction enzyme R subunit
VENNTFQVINQWTVVEYSEKRADVIAFVNGLPLVVIELKSPSRVEVDASNAYRQLKNYMKEVPSLFVYNAFCVMSDMATSKAGTITSDEDRFMKWKTTDGNYKDIDFASFDVLFEGMFEKNRFLDILENFILYSVDATDYIKILAAYHQYFAVNKALTSTQNAVGKNGKAGVFWHTQGSGKSLSMVFYVNKLQKLMDNPTFVVITDRNDLDDQLFGQFIKCSNFLRQEPKQATSRSNLLELLNNRVANGIFFTTMQKFIEQDEPLTNREDVIVISDEAHRSQYGLDTQFNPVTGEEHIGAARRVHDNLPNATFIGFTGTPIALRDRNTREVFGNYIDIYDMTRSVKDGATCPIHYESRVINLELDQKTLKEIDDKYDELSGAAEPFAIEQSKHDLSRMEQLIGADETINSLCEDLIYHYENYRQFEVTGTAMIVAFSRSTAMKIYNKILDLRPEWDEKIKLVMTGNNNDPEEWHDIIGNKSYKKELAKKFKDVNDPMKIAIVVDMWLTGFDVESLSTMYIHKPMKGHTLMQAIARVNRVYEGKEGGLIVDYIGISGALKKAMNDYSRDDKQYIDHINIAEKAYPEFQEKLEICDNLLYGLDYSSFFNGNSLERAKTIKKGVNFLLQTNKKEKKDEFIHQGLRLKQALSLCRSLTTNEEKYKAAYFEAIRTLLTRINSPGKISYSEINEQISNLLKHSIKSKGVINLFSDVQEEFSIFDEDFLRRIQNMNEENLAVKMLQKLLNDEINAYTKNNIVKSEKFSEMLEKSMNRYINGYITNQEVINELIEIAHEIKNDKSAGKKLGLTQEELAFYDAITKPENIKDFYQNDELIAITQELTDKLKSSRTIDWQKKQSARSTMRKMVKRLLKKHDYPPKGLETAIDCVLKQCEEWADNSI